MISKISRLSAKEVKRVLDKRPNVLHGKNVWLSVGSAGGRNEKYAFVVPKRVSKSAVRRNRLRRAGFDAARRHTGNAKAGTANVFVFKEGSVTLSTPEMEKEIKALLDKARQERYNSQK